MASPLLSSPRWPLARRLAVAVSLLLLVASFAIAATAEAAMQLDPGRNEYNLWAYEARHLPSKWLYEVGELFRSGRSLVKQDADIAHFFELSRQIGELEQSTAGNDAELRRLRAERGRLENRVEDSIEGRISAVLEDEGLTRKLVFLPRLVWPPVDFEFTEALQTLATSHRHKIELIDADLLREDLDLPELEAIERDTERREGVSALAAPAAGVGAYPAIVAYLESYEAALQVAAHEWVHNYLFFSPLGFNYYEDNDLRTMNETVADLVGHEVAAAVMRRWPPPDPAARPAPPRPAIDVGAELRRLRGEVDALLSEGKVEAAETLMEARRLELAAQGAYFRKLNQAYFAFNNLYAGESGSPAAVNPIGPKIDELRRRSPSLSAFIASVRGMTSVADLDAALASGP